MTSEPAPTLPKTFDPAAAEPRLYAAWEASGAFSPDSAAADAKPFTMVIPPPNVTGSLHIGHALNNTLQDILARYHRMKGEAVLWLPGTDHAGIATQMVVERQMAAQGNEGRRDIGRDAFVKRVWDWKAESGGAITRQLRRLGASCDWSRERFTLDEGLSAAVRKVFVQLYKEGLLYRDKRLVNWDPQFQTAISDLEVEQREVDGHYWRFAYPLEDGSGEVVVATTRPETMLGDTAVAVHPDDERYTHLVGKRVRLPIVGRLIPIVADAYADPEKGSGAVKITPAHDFNDFQVGKRHGLEAINILDPQARLNDSVPAEYVGMDRFVARKAIVKRAEQEGWLRGIDPTRHVVPHGDRSGAVIEPYLTDQWYVDAKTLAEPAIKAVEEGATRFEPDNWSKTYFEWMRNIEPWCVSRQLWWGHRIPAWFGPTMSEGPDRRFSLPVGGGEHQIFVEETEERAREAARAFYGFDIVVVEDSFAALHYAYEAAQSGGEARVPIWRDEDVLDTWFSSALWPFSTLGWPQDTADLRRFYPTDTLVTGFDIIFFWVARMMMMGMHFNDGTPPFSRVVINGLVRDEKGQKMSKSKGNVIDPLEIVDELGADALRFTMAILSGTRDIKLSKQRIEGYRNFGTKLWNAARFAQMNGCVRDPAFDPAAVREPVNRWIRGETVRAAAAVTEALEAAHFDEAAQALYRFIWNTVCDWYVELAKPVLTGPDGASKAETRAMVAWVLDQAMALLHPVSPFLTEELWAQTAGPGPRDTLLISAPWPDLPDAWIDAEADQELGWIIGLVAAVRTTRGELNVPNNAKVPLYLSLGSDESSWLRRNLAAVRALTSANFIEEVGVSELSLIQGGVAFAFGEHFGVLRLADFIDIAAERKRLMKEVEGLEIEATRFEKKLSNPDFVARAKPEVVEENRAKLAEALAAKAKLESALARLTTAGGG